MVFYIIDACCDVIDILPPKVLQWISVSANRPDANYESHVQAAFLAFRNEMRSGLTKGPGKEKPGKDAVTPGGGGEGGATPAKTNGDR